MAIQIHEYGYEGKVEDAVPVVEIHQARCNLCDWKSEEHEGGLDWKQAEADAIAHYENDHPDEDDDEGDDD
jgi:hypothetical protein